MHDIKIEQSIEESGIGTNKKHFLSFEIKSNIITNDNFEV